jgi:O-antigen/teichoic acid export membrane protein
MNARQITAFALGPITAAALGLITVPIVAWAFSAQDVGRLNVFNVTLSFFLLFSLLGLDQAFVREYHTLPNKARLLKSCFAPGFAIVSVLAIISVPFAAHLAKLLYGQPSAALFLLTLCAGAVSFAARYLSLILRMQEKGFAFSLSQILPKALLLLTVAAQALLSVHRTALELIGASALSLSAVLILLGWQTRSDWQSAIRHPLRRDDLPHLLTYGFPLIFSGITYWALTATGTISLRAFSTLAELANYSVATSFSNAAVVIQSIVSVIWTPLVFKWSAAGADMKRIEDGPRYALALVTTAFVLAGCLSSLTDLLLPAHYAEVKFLVVACAAQPLLYTFSVVTSVGIGVARRTELTLINTVAACACNGILNLALVPNFGARGAATANAFAFFVLFVTNTEAAARVWHPFARARIYAIMTIAVALAAGTALFGDRIPVNYSILWACALPIIGWTFRNEYLTAALRVRELWRQSRQTTFSLKSGSGESVGRIQ